MGLAKTCEEIMKIRKACRICREILTSLGDMLQEGITTADIEQQARELMREKGVQSAFLGYRGYPAAVCISVNDQVVHGIPSAKKKIRSGDIISVDIGVVYDGYYGDCAQTFPLGEVRPEHRLLISAAQLALKAGIEKAVPGNRVGDISAAIQTTVENFGFSVVRAFSGHGIGKSLHEAPEIPNFGIAGRGELLVEKMVLAIEPMVNEGNYQVKIQDDGWTVVTSDGSFSAHCEETVLIGKQEAEILTVV